jgi:hypothetical protein
VDVLAGDGLAEALTGADAVIDVLNTAATDPDETTSFFGRTSDNLLSAGQRGGVRHHVLLSIVSVDGVPDNAHYLGKVAQEQRAGSLLRFGPLSSAYMEVFWIVYGSIIQMA